MDQTNRYLGFEVARFGENRIVEHVAIEHCLGRVRVPSFIIQPLVENAVNHAMVPDAPLHVDVTVRSEGEDVIIDVRDDGCGMSEEMACRLVAAPAQSGEGGTGIALYKVDGRLKAVFGKESGVSVTSELGAGTTVTLLLKGAMASLDELDEDDDWDEDPD